MSTTEEGKKLQDEIKDSAHRVWLAGLGALAAASEEGGKIFQQLVERGKELESRGKEEVDKAKAKASDAVSEAGTKFDEVLTAALHRLGVPTRDEIHKLVERVEELTAKVEQLKPKVEQLKPKAS
jgi:poly(hydroxyalkanoate) granule-associated protein